MAYQIQSGDHGVQITLRGALTFSKHPVFRDLVENLGRTKAERVEFNLSQVSHVDAGGLGLLLIAKKSAGNAQFSLTGASGDVGRMLNITRFHDLFMAA